MAQSEYVALTAAAAELLDREAAALSHSRFDLLPDIIARKETLVVRIAESGLPLECATRIRRLTERNAAMLGGTMQGLGTALACLEALRRPGGGATNTYDGKGRRQVLGPQAGTAGKRA